VKFTQMTNRTGSTMLKTLGNEVNLRAEFRNAPALATAKHPAEN
jgi:hypothetical protein